METQISIVEIDKYTTGLPNLYCKWNFQLKM